jgi:hypothetical protein
MAGSVNSASLARVMVLIAVMVTLYCFQGSIVSRMGVALSAQRRRFTLAITTKRALSTSLQVRELLRTRTAAVLGTRGSYVACAMLIMAMPRQAASVRSAGQTS